MNSKNIALVAAAGVIAYLIYLYEKKKTVVTSQISQLPASTPTGIPISTTTPSAIDAILASNPVIQLPNPGLIPTGSQAEAAAASLPDYFSSVPNPYPAPYQIEGAYGSFVPGFSG